MLTGDRLAFLKGGFVTLYGRFASGGKPVFWGEYGMSIYPQCDAEMMERQRQYYANVLEMTERSSASGSAGWWWPGGFRQGENSDFGVTNPDGTPRPAAIELSKFAERLKKSQPRREPDTFFVIDRDKHITGFAGLYASLSGDYVTALESGKSLGLKTEATGTTSADTPLVAVGNTACTGHNPPKYLNAEFNRISMNGHEVSDGSVVVVERGKPVYLEASVGNTAEATWLAPRNAIKGGVYLGAVSAGTGPCALSQPIRRFLLTRPSAATFSLTRRTRRPYGPSGWSPETGLSSAR